jgi:predicted phage terminase large subunit-like protein
VWWVAPTYKAARDVIWPDLNRALKDVATAKSEVHHWIELPGGGSVTVKSADNPDNLRGSGLDGLVFDEAAFAKKSVWTEVLRPMLADRQGWAMFITTPSGCNWFLDMFRMAGVADGWERWQRPTADNPLITPGELDASLREIGPRAYAQEFGAQFTEEEGAMFPVDYFSDRIWFDEWPKQEEIDLTVLACDPSLGKTELADYSAIVVLVRKRGGGMYVRADIARRPPAKIIADSLDMYAEFNADAIGFETVGFQSLLIEEFYRAAADRQQRVWPLGVPSRDAKVKRVARLDGPLSRGEIYFHRGHRGTEMLVEQLRGFPLPAYHDDGPDALEMAERLSGAILRGEVRESGYEEYLTA